MAANLKRLDKLIEIILEDLPQLILTNGAEYEFSDIETFCDYVTHEAHTSWSQRGIGVRFALTDIDVGGGDYIYSGHVYFITDDGKGWGEFTQQRLDSLNKRFINEVGDLNKS